MTIERQGTHFEIHIKERNKLWSEEISSITILLKHVSHPNEKNIHPHDINDWLLNTSNRPNTKGNIYKKHKKKWNNIHQIAMLRTPFRNRRRNETIYTRLLYEEHHSEIEEETRQIHQIAIPRTSFRNRRRNETNTFSEQRTEQERAATATNFHTRTIPLAS